MASEMMKISEDLATQSQVAAILLRNDLQTVNVTIERINQMSGQEARDALIRILAAATHLTLPAIVRQIVRE